MASSLLGLAPELWNIVLDNLSRKDQLRVSQVTSQLCTLARRPLYREVGLSWSPGPDAASQATLALLARDHSVARNVEVLRVSGFVGPCNEPSWFNPNVFAGMVRLNQLNLDGMPFTREGQERFHSIVSEYLPALKKLGYISDDEHDDRESCSNSRLIPVLKIRGLEEVMLEVRDGFIHRSQIIPILTASCSTLVQIHIPSPIMDTARRSPLKQLFSLRFPHLSTLHLSGWNTPNPVDAASRLTTFLVAHPLIEVLCLDHSPPSRIFNYSRLSSDAALGPGALPNLRHLKADMYNLTLLARGGVLSLKTLETLNLGTGDSDPEMAFAEVCSALDAFGGLPGLTALKLELDEVDDEVGALYIEKLGPLCPALERFWGNIHVGIISVAYQYIFTSYSKLKLQMLPDTGLSTLSKKKRAKGIEEFVAHNLSVTDLRFYVPEDEDIIRYRFAIERDAQGAIRSVVVPPEDHSTGTWRFPGLRAIRSGHGANVSCICHSKSLAKFL